MATDSLDVLIQDLEGLDAYMSKGMPEEVGEEVIRLIHESFDTSTSPRGESWADVQRSGGKPLVVSGALRDSFTLSVRGHALTVTSSREWAGVHNEGATIEGRNGGRLAFRVNGRFVRPKSVTIPARPFTPDPNGDESSSPVWDDAIEKLVDARISKVGG